MPWAIRLRNKKTSLVCCSYGKHRGTVATKLVIIFNKKTSLN